MDFFCKCDQISKKLRIWSYFLGIIFAGFQQLGLVITFWRLLNRPLVLASVSKKLANYLPSNWQMDKVLAGQITDIWKILLQHVIPIEWIYNSIQLLLSILDHHLKRKGAFSIIAFVSLLIMFQLTIILLIPSTLTKQMLCLW